MKAYETFQVDFNNKNFSNFDQWLADNAAKLVRKYHSEGADEDFISLRFFAQFQHDIQRVWK